jgi:hypothetical protein
MSRTTPSTWTGLTPTLTSEKVKALEEQYKIALLDQDKSGSMEDESFYDGWKSALEWVLDVLHDKTETPRAAQSRGE